MIFFSQSQPGIRNELPIFNDSYIDLSKFQLTTTLDLIDDF
jgi:hypothetical protein